MTSIDLGTETPLINIPDEPYWSENFYFVGSDPRSGVAVVIHMGRWSKDTSLWREQALIFLPDGTFALAQNVGLRPSDRGPSGALMDLVCEEPGARWRLRYKGPARRTTQEELFSAFPLSTVPAQLLSLDLEFEAQSEIWDFGKALEGAAWMSFHYEQSGRIRGQISCDGQSVEMDGVAHRDHSRGPRRYGGIEKGLWMQGHFPGGRSFALIDTKWTGQEGKTLAKVFQDGRIYDATCSALPSIKAVDALPVEFAFSLESELGPMDVTGIFSRGLPKTFDDRNEVLYGCRVTPGLTAMVAVVGPTALKWNGQDGVGHVDFCWGPT